uniref:ATP-dependent (S)-NAD(P)H-hydrate dehydratase n=1 Tax=Globisporangium ultimum (strain ATCC 200006 / CBS 805.95 / DAOM BR144) TaxID=431595 RepID=K3XA99_GLOUD
MTIQARKLVRRLIPALTTDWRKGQHGRVGVVGGSFEYTGAPYYAGISCLKTGADLCHLFCTEEAAIPIKSYSPELIVHPLLRSDNSLKGLEASDRENAVQAAVDKISDVFSRLDTLVVGPGLGRDAGVQEITRQLIQRAKSASLPLVLDGDALFLISLEPDVIRGYTHAILTPNAMEYARLCVSIGLLDEADPAKAAKIHPAQLSQTLGPVVIKKGRADTFTDGENTYQNDEFGCPRRCGGQGDILTGAIATFVAWSKYAQSVKDEFSGNPLLLAAFGGSLVTRASALEAFDLHQRSMTSPDVLQSIGKGFLRAFPHQSAI